jgi:hypothetical protein
VEVASAMIDDEFESLHPSGTDPKTENVRHLGAKVFVAATRWHLLNTKRIIRKGSSSSDDAALGGVEVP